MPGWNISCHNLAAGTGNSDSGDLLFLRLSLITVTDENGAPVTGLGPLAFNAYILVALDPTALIHGVPSDFTAVPAETPAFPPVTEKFPGIYLVGLAFNVSLIEIRTDFSPMAVTVSRVIEDRPKTFDITKMGATTAP
jgi:hypothetical protein